MITTPPEKSSGPSKKKVLVIEDERNMLELLKFRLEESGYNVAVASDGFMALNQVRTFKPELIILDLMIPKIDGFTICRMLKYNDEYREIPLIILSARAAEEDIRRGLAMGADAYLTKPYEPADLMNKISELLNRERRPEPVPEGPVEMPPEPTQS